MGITMLIVEDDPDISYVLSANFKKDGYDVVTARTGELGVKLAKKHDPAIVILDVMLPKMDGLETLRELREFSAARVLFLTAKKDEIDRILGLKLGGDDYVTKPFSIEELRLRVKRLLRSDAAKPLDGLVRVGGVEVHFERHDVRVNGRPVYLAPREFHLLRALIEANGKVLSREKIITEFLGEDPGEEMEMDARGVDQQVARLRKKVDPKRRLILTVSKMGYQIKMDAPSPALVRAS